MKNENYSVLFLDDNSNRILHFKKNVAKQLQNDDYHIVKTAQEAILALQTKEEWAEVHLDHDLGGEVYQDSNREDCGMEVARWIVENRPRIYIIKIHSWNIPASKRMELDLRDAGYKVIRQPYAVN